MTCEQLPPEIWLQVIRWATQTSNRYPTVYEPFGSALEDYYESDYDHRVVMMASINRVCRQWRALVDVMLYENVYIGSVAITAALKADEPRGGYVRGVILPYSSTKTMLDTSVSVAILKRLPNLEVLVRPRPRPDFINNTPLDFEADGLPLPSLKRLDWRNHVTATRTGGINSLNEVLRSTVNLQYLSLSGNFDIVDTRLLHHFPALTTLHLRAIHPNFIEQICLWSFPALVHIILNGSPSHNVLSLLWEKFGGQIQTLEFGRSLRFLVDDHLTFALRECPNLHEVSYHINITTPPSQKVMHTYIRCVRLKGLLPFAESEWNWGALQRHFEFLTEPSLPSLQRVILYGDEWNTVLPDPRFNQMHLALGTRGCVLERPDGTHIIPQ